MRRADKGVAAHAAKGRGVLTSLHIVLCWHGAAVNQWYAVVQECMLCVMQAPA